jgi:hypothetical protein
MEPTSSFLPKLASLIQINTYQGTWGTNKFQKGQSNARLFSFGNSDIGRAVKSVSAIR